MLYYNDISELKILTMPYCDRKIVLSFAREDYKQWRELREEIEISEYDRLNALKQALEEKIRVILEWEEYFMYKDLKHLLDLKNEIEKKMGVLWENNKKQIEQ